MRNHLKYIIKLLFVATMFISINALPAFAFTASGNSGDAVYRSGGWSYGHAAILYQGRDGNSYVVEAKGTGYPITEDPWETFLPTGSNYTYYGVFYNPSYQPGSSILNTAFALVNNPAITYTFLGQMYYDSTASTYITVDHITQMRCDGVVEYSYEWNGSNVWGPGQTNYDISYKPYTTAHQSLGALGQFFVCPLVQCGQEGFQYTMLRPRP